MNARHESPARGLWTGLFVVLGLTVAASSTALSMRRSLSGDPVGHARGMELSEGSKEYQIKAAFLLNFARYASWPKGTFAKPDSPIVFGIVGKDPFGPEIDKTLKDKKVGNRPVIIWRFSKVEDVSGVHVLFVGRLSHKNRALLKKRLSSQPVLTVGDEKGMAGKGVIVAFYLVKKKVRFEISIRATRDSGLALSSQLLKLAHIKDRELEPERRSDVVPDEEQDK